MKVAIVGSGVIGLATACALARRGAEVTVVGDHPPGTGASANNAGWIVPAESGPVPAPGLIGQALRWMLQPDSPVYVRPIASPAFIRFMVGMARACTPRAYACGLRRRRPPRSRHVRRARPLARRRRGVRESMTRASCVCSSSPASWPGQRPSCPAPSGPGSRRSSLTARRRALSCRSSRPRSSGRSAFAAHGTSARRRSSKGSHDGRAPWAWCWSRVEWSAAARDPPAASRSPARSARSRPMRRSSRPALGAGRSRACSAPRSRSDPARATASTTGRARCRRRSRSCWRRRTA